jgi:PAS domain S-box-containing protein
MSLLPNILIVDDNEDNLALLESILKRVKVNLIQALSGAEALEKTQRETLALAIIDVYMPVMNGYELAAKMNEERSGLRVPIIFITANYVDDNKVIEGYGSGAVDYIFKPVNINILLCKVKVFIDLFNQKQLIIKDAAVLRKSTEVIERTQEILTISEEKCRDFLHLRQEGILISKDTDKFIEVNDAVSNMTGYSRDELLSMTWSDILTHESLTDILAFFVKVVSNCTSIGEIVIRHKNGSPRKWTIEAIKLDENRILSFIKNKAPIRELTDSLKTFQMGLKNQKDELTQAIVDAELATENFAKSYQFAPSGFFTLSEQRTILELNPSGAQMLGENLDKLINCHFDHFISKETLPAFNDFFLKVFNLKSKVIGELVLETADGQKRYVHIEGISAGYGKQCLLNVVDITQRKIAEDALKESEERFRVLNEELEDRVKERTTELSKTNSYLLQTEEKFRTIANFTHDWEFWLDQDGGFLFCSPSCEKITGYSASEFIQNPNLFFDIIHPDDLKFFRSKKYKIALTKEAINEIQYRIIRPDGTTVWIGYVSQPIYNDSGKFIGMRGSNRDITIRKKIEQLLIISNQKYQLLSENISDGIFIYENEHFEYVNSAMTSIFGYDGDEFERLKLVQLVMPDYQEELRNKLVSFARLDKVWDVELGCSKKDGTGVFVEILFNNVNKEKRMYGVVHDITGKKQLQEDIVKAIIQTEEKERANFSKELHDGLGPLLSAIKLYLQWSQRPKSASSREEIIRKAEDILEEALTAVKEISNKLSPHLLMYHGLTSAIQSFVDKLEETSEIVIDFQSNAGRRFGMEIEAALYRAIIECINNTIKHAKASKIFIKLDDNGSQLQLRYSDDGTGFNLTEALSTQTGLGLFNLQNRIQTIGGKITMLSEPGQGVDYQIIVNL